MARRICKSRAQNSDEYSLICIRYHIQSNCTAPIYCVINPLTARPVLISARDNALVLKQFGIILLSPPFSLHCILLSYSFSASELLGLLVVYEPVSMFSIVHNIYQMKKCQTKKGACYLSALQVSTA